MALTERSGFGGVCIPARDGHGVRQKVYCYNRKKNRHLGSRLTLALPLRPQV